MIQPASRQPENVTAPTAPRHARLRCWLRRLALTATVLVVLTLLTRLVFFQGPYRAPEPLPEGKLLDMHCHVAGIGAGDSGCFVAPRMQDSWKFDFYLRAFGVTRAEVEAKGDQWLVQRLSEQIAESRHVGAAIILAMDGVVDEHGQLDRRRTEFYVPNEFVATAAARHTNLLFGASINPYRPDALQRLVWAKEHGAKLVKWIPSIMAIDPADARLEPFYRKLVELDLPLLTHAEQERSFTHAQDELCDPDRLRLPLKLGVQVIVAHASATGANHGERNPDRLKRLLAEYPNLQADVSSLTQINKLGSLRDAIGEPLFSGRLLYGTDFPLINMPLVSPWWFPLNLRFAQMRAIAAIPNPWDRDVALKQALGVPRAVFEQPGRLFLNDGHAGQSQNPVGANGRSNPRSVTGRCGHEPGRAALLRRQAERQLSPTRFLDRLTLPAEPSLLASAPAGLPAR
jgi:predicted TIM-barrel fold metal-dependent hydrolase